MSDDDSIHPQSDKILDLESVEGLTVAAAIEVVGLLIDYASDFCQEDKNDRALIPSLCD
jgi:hypothetical protein